MRSGEGMKSLQAAMERVVKMLQSVASAGNESMSKAQEGTAAVTRVVSAIQSIAEDSEKIEGIVNVDLRHRRSNKSACVECFNEKRRVPARTAAGLPSLHPR